MQLKPWFAYSKIRLRRGGKTGLLGEDNKGVGWGHNYYPHPPPPNKNIEMSKYGDLIIFAFTLLCSFLFHLFSLCLFLFHLFPFASLFTLYYFPLFAPQNLGWGTSSPLCHPPPPWKRPGLHNCLVFYKHSQLNKYEYDKYYVRIIMALLLNDKSLIGLTIETIKIKIMNQLQLRNWFSFGQVKYHENTDGNKNAEL